MAERSILELGASHRRDERMSERITLTDNIQDIVAKLSEGNPGALTVCMGILEKAQTIDPDAAMSGLMSLLKLDSLGVYGPRIWMLYKDVCGEDLVTTLAYLRAWQLGHITREQLDHAIDNYGEGLDKEQVIGAVKKELPRFGRGRRAD
jgi:hypothetical protein